MRLKLILPIACLSLFIACNSSKERPIFKERTLESIDPTPDKWGGFWETFSNAVQQRDLRKVASLTRLPLPDVLGDREMSEKEFALQFNYLFDERTADKFAQASDKDFRALPSNAETSGHMKTPEGIELKILHVENSGQEGASKTFVFGEMEGQYKLLAVIVPG